MSAILSPDVEKAFADEQAWPGRRSPPVTNTAIAKQRRPIPEKRPSPPHLDAAAADDGDEHDDAQRMHSDTPQRRLSPLAVYGWLHRHSGYLFLLAVFLAFLRAGLHAAAPPVASSPARSPPSSFVAKAKSYLNPFASGPREHPIPGLMDAADTRFRAKLARQSTSLPAAVAEYKRRYGRAPPAGFDKWYAFAVQHGFVLIDEFDAIVEDLKPFWELDGAEFRRRVGLVTSLPSVDIVRVRGGKGLAVSGGQDFKDSEAGARAKGFKAMLDACVKNLPDIDFPINAKAEGRIVVPWEHTTHPNLTDLDPPFPSPDWAGTGSVWNSWRRTCAPHTPARRLYSSLGSGWAGAAGARDRLAEGYYDVQARVSGTPSSTPGAPGAASGGSVGGELAFAKNTGASGTDFCRDPAAHYEQGHFFSDWRTLPLLAPIFSPGRTQGFADIRIPSHYYYGGTRRYTYAWDPINLEQRAVDPMEMPWTRKRDAVFWRGASTGGGSSPPGFGSGYQRHRFLRMASVGYVPGTRTDNERTTALTFALPPVEMPASTHSSAPGDAASTTSLASDYEYVGTTEGGFTTARVPLAELNRDVMDVAFVKEVVPVAGAQHRIGDSVDLGFAWGYKYLLDLDGMGYSGRFMAFLASDSVPVKATVYDEFFSGWIEPWVHYIPLSHSYAEIYNIVAYFSGAPPSALRAAGLPSSSTAPVAPYFGAPPVTPPPGYEDEEDEDEDDDLQDDGVDEEGVEHRIGASDPRIAPPVDAAGAGPGLKRRAAVPEPKAQSQKSGESTRSKRASAQVPLAVQSAAEGEGDRRLRRIARAGKQWKLTMGRKVDMEVYVYRLALEYARLWSDDREKMSYKG